MRGKGSSVILDCVISGITPAYAGKRSAAYCFGVRVEDHPRLCGEKNYEKRNKNEYQGSPPPMRGKVRCTRPLALVVWITPAYAGKSYWVIVSQRQTEDHPRLCGEKKTA